MGGSDSFGSLGAALRFMTVLLIITALSLAFLVIVQALVSPFHVVVSDSMAPNIQTGDAVIMRDIDTHNVSAGEVIVFVDPVDKESLVIHRVVNIGQKGETPMYTTKGDNNPVADPEPVYPGMIVGSLSRNVPKFGHFLNFVSTPAGYIVCVVVPGALSFIFAFSLALAERNSAVRNKRRLRNLSPQYTS